jgi:hypothetical protein
MKANSK